ncbi:transcriptional regulator [Acidobacteria bacterium AB60]|nr:transcriptional regulator [Acidobacteria bacterium AB60]
MLRVGEWTVDPVSGEMTRGAETARLEVRALRLLLYLAERQGQVVSIEELLTNVWAGVTVSSDSVYQAVTSLRRQLGDDPRKPAYIATVPRLGYRMLATVSHVKVSEERASMAQPAPSDSTQRVPKGMSGRRRMVIAAGAGVCVVAFIVVMLNGGVARRRAASAASVSPPAKSVAVLPFLDLTEGMKNEEFADGVTEELIDKLSKVPGLSVPAPTASFYFKGKQVPVGEIARSLGVAYILDGSVRKSGGQVRIAARLVRADNGYVMWSETYDRPFADRLSIQDDIAGQVTRALRASIGG